MKKIAVFVLLALGMAFVAQGQQGDSDVLLEKLLVLQFTEEAKLDAYDLAEFLQGYAEYRATMDGLQARQAEARSALEAAIASDNGADIATKMRALMAADKAILDAMQAAVSEASAVLSAADVAKLYLTVSNLDAAKQALRAKLTTPCPAMPCMSTAVPAAQAISTVPDEAVPPLAVTPTMTEEEEVMAQVKALLADFMAAKVDKLLDYVSEDFEHHQVGDKKALADYLEMGKAMGYVDEFPQWVKDNDGEISLDNAEVKIKDGKATVYPIDAVAAIGSVSVELVFKKDPDGVWRVITAEVDGI